MTREDAINIARQRAHAAGQRGDHEYLPKTSEEAATWQPHEWVIEAVMDVANLPLDSSERAALTK